MAYDRHDPRRGSREQSRYSDDRFRDREFGDPERYGRDRDHGDRDRGPGERGFFERAGDEIASWFGDDEAERRRRDERMGGRDDDFGRDHEPSRFGRGPDRSRFEYDRDDDRDYRPSRERGYRPITGDYGRSEGLFAASGLGRGDEGPGRFAGSSGRSLHDPNYQQWRQRQIDELDRDYDEYRREHQSKFESDFSNWRSDRQTKRQMLGQVREHMEVIASDDEHVGTVDRVAGDRLILAKSDPESGGVHHSLSCSEIERIEGDRVILAINATEARIRWRDESRERALFEREDQGEAGARMLDRSFSGTYR